MEVVKDRRKYIADWAKSREKEKEKDCQKIKREAQYRLWQLSLIDNEIKEERMININDLYK